MVEEKQPIPSRKASPLSLNCFKLTFLPEGDDEVDVDSFNLDGFNMNECVAALLRKPREDSLAAREIKRRLRKNRDQVKILENEYAKGLEWTREFIKNIAERHGLRES